VEVSPAIFVWGGATPPSGAARETKISWVSWPHHRETLESARVAAGTRGVGY